MVHWSLLTVCPGCSICPCQWQKHWLAFTHRPSWRNNPSGQRHPGEETCEIQSLNWINIVFSKNIGCCFNNRMAFLKVFKLQSPSCVLPTTHATVQLLGKLRCEHVGGQSSTFPVWQSACVTSTIPFMQPEHKHVSLSHCSRGFPLLSDWSV